MEDRLRRVIFRREGLRKEENIVDMVMGVDPKLVSPQRVKRVGCHQDEHPRGGPATRRLKECHRSELAGLARRKEVEEGW